MADFVKLMQGTPLKWDLDDERMEMFWESNQWVLEPVIKGRRYQCLIQDGNVSFSTIMGNNISQIDDKVGHLVEQLRNFTDETLLDGYITANNDVNRTLHILETPMEKLQQNECHLLNYVISDIIYNGEVCTFEYPFFDRRKILEQLELDGCIPTSYIRLSDLYYDLKFKRYKEINSDFDAFYFKDLDSTYTFRKSTKWKIFKELQRQNVVIMDIVEGNGRYEGMCGLVSIGQYKNDELVHITNVSGMSTDDRIDLFLNRDKYLGKVLEIKVLGKSDNNFIEARYSKLRLDLEPGICVWED